MDEAGIAAFILGIVVNQLTNVIQAMIWWSYWPADSLLVWVSVAYVSFWSGVELARPLEGTIGQRGSDPYPG